jgi:hypothetical protein
MAGAVTVFRFDLDDIGAEVTQRLRRIRTEHDGRDVDHPNAGKWAGRAFRLIHLSPLRGRCMGDCDAALSVGNARPAT